MITSVIRPELTKEESDRRWKAIKDCAARIYARQLRDEALAELAAEEAKKATEKTEAN